VVAVTSLEKEEELRQALLGEAMPALRGKETDERSHGKAGSE
jgi:hypothetical protein